MKAQIEIKLCEKPMLTVKEARQYFSMGEKNVRKIAKEHPEVALLVGTKVLIHREKMEKCISEMVKI